MGGNVSPLRQHAPFNEYRKYTGHERSIIFGKYLITARKMLILKYETTVSTVSGTNFTALRQTKMATTVVHFNFFMIVFLFFQLVISKRDGNLAKRMPENRMDDFSISALREKN